MKTLVKVRLLDNAAVQENKSLDKMAIQFEGTLDAAKTWCEMWAGVEFVADTSIYGGYYANINNGDCFLLT